MGFFGKLFKNDDQPKVDLPKVEPLKEDSPLYWINHGINNQNIAQQYWLAEKYTKADLYYEQAINSYEKVIVLDPNIADAWYRAGQSYFGRGSSVDNDEMFKKAIEFCKKALEIAPNNPALKTNAEDIIAKANQLLNYKK